MGGSEQGSEGTPFRPGLPRAFRALRSPAFRLIWGSYIVSQAGFWISYVSLQLLVVRLSGGNPTKQGLLIFFNFVPTLLFVSAAGMVADIYSRKHVVVLSQLALSLAAGALALTTALGLASLGVVYVLAFILGSAMALGMPVGQAIIANSVPRADLSSAVSLQSVGINLCRVAGPAIAVPIVLAGGPAVAFAVYSASALVTGLLLARMKLAPLQVVVARPSFWGHLRHGFDHARERPPALIILALAAVSGLFASTYGAIIPIYAVRILHLEAAGFFAIVVAIGLGAAIGALATGFAESAPRAIQSAFLMVALGAALILFGVIRGYLLALGAAALVGALHFALNATMNTTLQNIIHDQSRGRVMALFVLATAGCIPIGGLLIGVTASLVGPSIALILFGGVAAAFAGIVAAILLSTPRAAAETR